MTLRAVVSQAVHEIQAEFTRVVERKLEELFEASSKRSRRPTDKMQARSAQAPSTRGATRASRRSGKRHRSTAEDMQALRDEVLNALEPGVLMKKSDVIAAAKLSEEDSARVTHILAKLKAQKLVKMQGVRGSATYMRRAD